MQQLWLEELRIENFKGIDDLQINFTTSPFIIKGANRAGKSTIYDAFPWLLFNKDSLGRTNFQVLPVDDSGEVIPGNEASVEALLNINGRDKVRLKRVFAEKFTKKRSGIKPVKTGHISTYYVNDMNSPVKEQDFKARVSALCPADIFTILTNPATFFLLPWQKQREQLFKLCKGKIPEEDAVLQDSKYALIVPEIKEYGYTLEEFQKGLKSQIRKTKKEVEYLPVQIKERRQGIKKVKRPLIKDKEQIKLQLKRINLPTSDEEEIRKLKIEIDALHARKSLLQRELQVFIEEKEAQTKTLISELTRKCEADRIRIRGYNDSLKEARTAWEKLASEEIKLDTICPTCGQDLPEAERLKVFENAKNKKAEELKKIALDGGYIKEKRTASEIAIKENNKKVWHLKNDPPGQEQAAETQAYNEKIEAVEKELKEKDSAFQQLQQEEQQVESANRKKEIAALEAQLADWETQQAEYEMMKNDEARIVKLKEEQKVVAESFELLQQKLALVEEAIATKITGTLDAISAYFDTVGWKLFDKKINGEISQCCEAMVDGVLYDHGLNNGTKINAGLEVIKALQDFYGYRMPIFIDNAECLSSVTDMHDTQLIYLVVPENKAFNQGEIMIIDK